MSACSLDDFRNVLEDVLEVEGLSIGPDTMASDIAQWDSLNHVRLLVRLEQLYGINFRVDQVETVRNVGELVALVNALKETDARD